MFDFMSITKALADENRVRILLALSRHDELCVCQLIDMLHLSPSTVSKHLFILRTARLIKGRKEGRWMYYRLHTEKAAPMVAGALAWVIGSVSDDAIARQDADRLNTILSESAESKCA